MARHTKKEFATKCNLPTKNLATYISRGNVIVDEVTGLIDDTNPKNKLFLSKRSGLETEADVIARIVRVPAPESTPTPTGSKTAETESVQLPKEIPNRQWVPKTGIPDINDESAKLKAEQVKKTEKENLILDLRIKKINGEVVPSELIMPVFQQHNKHVVDAFKIALDELVREIAFKTDMPSEDVAVLKGKIVTLINNGIEKATSNTAQSIETVIRNYTIRRAESGK